MNDIWLKSTSQNSSKQFISQDSTLALVGILLVIKCICEHAHDTELAQGRDTLAAHNTSQTVCGTALGGIALDVEELVEHFLDVL